MYFQLSHGSFLSKDLPARGAFANRRHRSASHIHSTDWHVLRAELDLAKGGLLCCGNGQNGAGVGLVASVNGGAGVAAADNVSILQIPAYARLHTMSVALLRAEGAAATVDVGFGASPIPNQPAVAPASPTAFFSNFDLNQALLADDNPPIAYFAFPGTPGVAGGLTSYADGAQSVVLTFDTAAKNAHIVVQLSYESHEPYYS